MIKRSNEINLEAVYNVLLYGKPGATKSTTACSAPNPLLIDVDRGITRIHAPSRPEAFIQPQTYQELLDDISGNLSEYKTIIVDTLGRLLELMTAHALKVNPKLLQSDGTLTQKGWGWLGNEFHSFANRIRSLNKNVVYVAHAVEEQDGEQKVYRIDAGGKAKKEIFKDMDLVGFVEIQGNKPMINFGFSERYYTKNSIGITDFESLPNVLKGEQNNYLTNLFSRASAKAAEDGERNKKYAEIKRIIISNIEFVSDAETATNSLDAIYKMDHVYHSLAEARHLLNEKVRILGLEWDAKTKKFKAATNASNNSKPA
jgi:hypothetical protein